MAKPIPDGYHSLTPHLVVRDAARAIDFYKRAFGATEIARMAGPGGKVMHAEIQIGDSRLMLADEFPQMKCMSPLSIGGTGTTIHLYVEDADSAFKRAVDAGATTQMPLADMFWGDRYGQVVDPFGHQWSIATHKRDMTEAEMRKAGEEAMKQMSAGGAPGGS